MWLQRISVGIQGLAGNTKNVGNQGGDAENQGRNSSIAVEILGQRKEFGVAGGNGGEEELLSLKPSENAVWLL